MSNFVDSSNLAVILSKIKSWADGRFLTSHQDISGKVDKESGKGLSTNDFTTTLKNKLDGIASGAEVNVQADWNQTSTSADDYIKNKPTLFSGSYNDLLDKPTIPTIPNLSKGTTSGSGNAVTDISVSGHTVTLTKGTTFLTEHQSLANYYTKAQTDAAISASVGGAVGDVISFDMQVVDSLPASGTKGIIYLLAHSHGTNDSYDEYMWTGSAFEKIGNTDIDLSGYQEKITNANKLPYSLISGTPSIPAAVSKATLTDTWGFAPIVMVQFSGGIYGGTSNTGTAYFRTYEGSITVAQFQGMIANDKAVVLVDSVSGIVMAAEMTYDVDTNKITIVALRDGSNYKFVISSNGAYTRTITTFSVGATADSALTAAQIKSAFVTAGYYTESNYPS